jgi:hypothetical protein
MDLLLTWAFEAQGNEQQSRMARQQFDSFKEFARKNVMGLGTACDISLSGCLPG